MLAVVSQDDRVSPGRALPETPRPVWIRSDAEAEVVQQDGGREYERFARRQLDLGATDQVDQMPERVVVDAVMAREVLKIAPDVARKLLGTIRHQENGTAEPCSLI
jgi:hypothetical protein